MFSNLASYIFGGSSDEQQPNDGPRDQQQPPRKPNGEDDWVVVGGDVQPALTLGSLDEMGPRPSTGSTGSSEAPSEMEDEEMVIVQEATDQEASGAREIALTRSARRLTSPLACPNGIGLPQMKALRSSQKSKQKDASKALSSKATERQNKAVKIRSNHSGKRNKAVANIAVKASGFNKHLKQC